MSESMSEGSVVGGAPRTPALKPSPPMKMDLRQLMTTSDFRRKLIGSAFRGVVCNRSTGILLVKNRKSTDLRLACSTYRAHRGIRSAQATGAAAGMAAEKQHGGNAGNSRARTASEPLRGLDADRTQRVIHRIEKGRRGAARNSGRAQSRPRQASVVSQARA